MKVVVQGRKEIRYYEFKEDTPWNKKPCLIKDWEKTKEEFVIIKEMEVDSNHILLNTYNYDDILITDYKDDKVDGEFKVIYDLEEDVVYLKSDVCIELLEPNKEEMEKELEDKLKIWNKETIEKDERLNAYCELHKLDKETVDIDELKRLLPYHYAKGGLAHVDSVNPFGNSFIDATKKVENVYAYTSNGR